jgi:CRISPR-associated protein Cas5d
MAHPLPSLEVKLWGDWACFTRPEMKVERVSYPVMTPSAARGALEAIFWKPQVRWYVEEIHVLKPIEYASLLRNEVNTRQSERSARDWARKGGGYDATADRAQRHTLALRDVAYLVRAQLELTEGVSDNIAKYRDQETSLQFRGGSPNHPLPTSWPTRTKMVRLRVSRGSRLVVFNGRREVLAEHDLRLARARS